MASTPEQVVCTPTFVFPAAFPETYGKLLIAEASSCYGFDPRQHLPNFHGPPTTTAQQVAPPTSSAQEEQGGTKPLVSKASVSPRGSLTTLKIPHPTPPLPPSTSGDYSRCLSSAPVAFPGIDPTKLPKVEHPPEQTKNDKLWPCPSCKVPFKAASELQQHLGQHTRGEQRGVNVPSVPCEVCGKLFASPDRVRAHVRAAHGEKACACDICGSGFSYRCKLLDHMRTHTGDKPFRCDVCGKTFSQKNHLTRHAMIHTGERPFPCDFCGRGFYRKDKLARHRRVHTGERPHVCLACGKSYGRREKLARHLRAHAGERPFACAACGRRFLEPRDLHRHKCPSRCSGEQQQTPPPPVRLLSAPGTSSAEQLASLYERLQSPTTSSTTSSTATHSAEPSRTGHFPDRSPIHVQARLGSIPSSSQTLGEQAAL